MFVTSCACAQSWQWGKRGGSSDQIDALANHRQEEVTGIVTDSNKNIYVTSYVGKYNLDVDGHAKSNYGDDNSLRDAMLASFSCDGSYRWSKVIGAAGHDQISSPVIDADDNVYVSGKFGGFSYSPYAHHIDNDLVFPIAPNDYRLLYLVKFDHDGNLLWFRNPQPSDVTAQESTQTVCAGFAGDELGNTYWLLGIPPGVYADGAFTNSLPGTNYFIFKYDNEGVFQNAIPLNMQLTGSSSEWVSFYRNPNNGDFFVSSRKYQSESVTVNGNAVTHPFFIANFNDEGQFQWLRQHAGDTDGTIELYNFAFDDENNVYMGCRFTGLNLATFLGFSISDPISSGTILKLNPTCDSLIWGTYNNKGSGNYGAVALNGDEVGFTSYCFGNNFTWGSQTLDATAPNQGQEVLLARFDKTTGDCIALSKIPGDVGYTDCGTALTVDASGDYIVGGGFGHILYVDGGNQITSNGGQSDFFVAKYATEACSPLSVNENGADDFSVWPNPFSDTININSEDNGTYSIHDMRGVWLASGNINPGNNTLDTTSLPAGLYMLKMDWANGETKTVKLIRE